MDTARLVFGSAPQLEPALGNLFLVTHGSTRLALTGGSPATSEMVVLAPRPDGAFRVAGRLAAS